MKNKFWEDFWNKSAKEHEDVRFIAGWGNRTFQEMLLMIVELAKKLELKYKDRLLDAGCGPGIFEIAYSPYVREIYAIDFSEEMLKINKKYTKNLSNVIVRKATINDLPFSDDFFDKILVNSVVQYLRDLNEVEEALEEIGRVARKRAKILVSRVPDASKKDDYIREYYKLNLSDKEIRKKTYIVNKCLWFDKNDVIEIGKKVGFETKVLGVMKNVWWSKYYFDILFTKRCTK